MTLEHIDLNLSKDWPLVFGFRSLSHLTQRPKTKVQRPSASLSQPNGFLNKVITTGAFYFPYISLLDWEQATGVWAILVYADLPSGFSQKTGGI